jgi:hypothetical protein
MKDVKSSLLFRVESSAGGKEMKTKVIQNVLAVLALAGMAAQAQKGFEPLTGKPFDDAVPKDFYLEGNSIPVQKRNASVVRAPAGARAVFALIDTTGYSSDIQTKYVGMIITEGDLTICGKRIGTGSYGFGWTKPGPQVDQPGKFSLYDQAGKPVASCVTPRDAKLPQPRPLQLVPGSGDAARLYYGRHYLELK